MAENKTIATAASVQAFIKALPEPRRSDAKALARIMQSVSHEKPKMWGPSIVGFGSYHYRYNTGREGDMPLTCFSPRKSGTVVYNMGSADKALLKRLGKHALNGSCLHIKKLTDVDHQVLRTLVEESLVQIRTKYAT
jgi:hypothetical protein